ncbi:MAG: DUF2779 domain-containing protein [Gemmatimonadaceae bacterium]|nr:DUF2779 domain-containing protein [Gemmatimonadaceae bacterium]
MTIHRTLSKSDFKVARDCPTKLFYKESGTYASVRDDDPYLALLAQGGYMIEQLAKAHYPLGREMGDRQDPAQAWAATEHAIRAGTDVTLFEATLLRGQQMARVDILERRGNRLRLIEVKAKSWDTDDDRERAALGKPTAFRTGRRGENIATSWRKYLEDVTFQCLLLESLFPEFTVDPFLCLINKSARCRTDALPSFFGIQRDTLPNGRTRLVNVSWRGDAAIAAQEQLTIELPVREEVEMLRDEVEAATAMLLASYQPQLTRIAPVIGTACRDCEYRVSAADMGDHQRNGFAECWGAAADVQPHLLELYHVAKFPGVTDLIAAGAVGLLDVPDDVVQGLQSTGKPIAARQALQISHTKSGQTYVGSGLRAALEHVVYPLHFLDFEAARTAVPFHAGMQPYGLLAFQFSCHVQDAPGAPLRHIEWINTDRVWPNEAFARALSQAIGPKGTVLTWSPFEVSTLRTVREELRENGRLDAELESVLALADKDAPAASRVLDLHRLAQTEFFHPGMGGRTSIKVVLDALWRSDAAMREHFFALTGTRGDAHTGPYAALEPLVIAGVQQEVAEGTGAIKAYEALIFGAERHDANVQAAWRQLLLAYCKLDTLAMVLVWEYWRRCVGL